MSAFNEKADLLAARLAKVVGLESFSWVVDRDADLQAEFIKATKKKLGLGVIRWMGGPNPDPNALPLAIASAYNISLFLKPSLRRGKPPGDSLAQLTALAVHHWSSEDTPTKTRVRFEVLACRPIDTPPKERLQAFLIVAQSITQLPRTTITLNP
jgi:hypothetical protein